MKLLSFVSTFLFCGLFLLLSSCDPVNSQGKKSSESTGAVSGSAAADEESDKRQILECFNRYKRAVLNDKGEEALECVDQKTRRYYSEAVELIKTATKEEVKKLSLLNRMNVLLMRHKAPKETILGMDGNDLFVYGVNNGMISKDSTVGLQLGTITVEGDFAKSNIITRGKEAPFGYHFYRENGKWKIDLTSVFTVATAAFQTLIAQQEMTEDEFLTAVLENITGKEPGDSVWEPLEP